MAETFFKQGNGASQHTVHAMGHAHIDTGLSILSTFPNNVGHVFVSIVSLLSDLYIDIQV